MCGILVKTGHLPPPLDPNLQDVCDRDRGHLTVRAALFQSQARNSFSKRYEVIILSFWHPHLAKPSMWKRINIHC